MEEKKLADEEIVKALECCINECDCENCYNKGYQQAVKDTAERFAERLKEKADINVCLYGSRIVYVGDIDEICKELTEVE